MPWLGFLPDVLSDSSFVKVLALSPYNHVLRTRPLHRIILFNHCATSISLKRNPIYTARADTGGGGGGGGGTVTIRKAGGAA